MWIYNLFFKNALPFIVGAAILAEPVMIIFKVQEMQDMD